MWVNCSVYVVRVARWCKGCQGMTDWPHAWNGPIVVQPQLDLMSPSVSSMPATSSCLQSSSSRPRDTHWFCSTVTLRSCTSRGCLFDRHSRNSRNYSRGFATRYLFELLVKRLSNSNLAHEVAKRLWRSAAAHGRAAEEGRRGEKEAKVSVSALHRERALNVNKPAPRNSNAGKLRVS